MRRLALVLSLTLLALAACAKTGGVSEEADSTGFSDTVGQTGARNQNGVPYITNGYKPIEEALEQEVSPSAPQPANGGSGSMTVQPSEPSQQKLTPVTGHELRLRLKEFEITRFKLNEFKPSRFGDHRYRIRVFFKNEPEAEFNGTFTSEVGKLKIDATAGQYRLSGYLTDSAPLRVDGDLKLYDSKSKELARIFYNAYKAALTVHQDRTKQVVTGSNFEKQLQALRDHTFGWVHNWMVLRGPAFYLVDIVKQVEDGSATGGAAFAPPLMAFKGESLRTGDEDHPAESLTPKLSKDISLVGNSETSRRRWFQTKLEDPDSKEENNIILDVHAERAPKSGVTAQPNNTQSDLPDDDLEDDEDDDTGDSTPPVSAPENSLPSGQAETSAPRAATGTTQPAKPAPPTQPTKPLQPPAPLQPKPQLQPQPPAPLINGAAYLKFDLSLPRTARMTRDFARNRKIPGVLHWMKVYANPNDWHHRDLAAFYRCANPFRPMIETIGRAYDVSPSYAYLTVIESPYFTGCHYQITSETKSTAVGPFQLLIDTAAEMGMSVRGGYDERRFFIPSACGAARYIVKLAREFESRDTTVAILGYFQGDGGAARAIACTYKDKSMCYGKNWSRYKQLVHNYNFTYAQIANVAAIPADQLDYVNKKLAIYFISEDIGQYGFPTSNGVKALPNNGTLFPTRAISDPVCRQTAASLVGI